MNKSESNSVSKLLPRKERFQMFLMVLKKYFRPEHFYEFYQIANRYMRNGKYLSEETIQKIEEAIRNETVDLFFDIFVDALRVIYKQDSDLFYTLIGYLFGLGNDTYLLELFLEFEVDPTLRKLIQLTETFPIFEIVEDIYKNFLDEELFRKILSSLQTKGLFIISNDFNVRTFTQAIVVVFALTNIVFYPKNQKLVALPFDEFLDAIFS